MRINSRLFAFILLTLVVIVTPMSKGYAQSDDQFKIATEFLSNYKKLLLQAPSDSVNVFIRQTIESGFKFLKGDERIFKNLTEFTDFSISLFEGVYTVYWGIDGSTILSCQFPANYGMMTFSNKIDLEKSIYSRLSAIPEVMGHKEGRTVLKNKVIPVEHSDFYILDNGFYITPRLRNLTIYSADAAAPDSFRLLMDREGMYVLESIQNMMLTGQWTVPIFMNMTLSEYGYNKTNITKPMSGVYSLLTQDGNEPYWGLESFDGHTIKGLVIWRNEYGGYNHVMSVEFPIEILASGGEIKTKMFCYIRTDNLKSLFEEFM